MLSEQNRKMPLADYIHHIGRQARQAGRQAETITTAQKTTCLQAVIDKLNAAQEHILVENAKDVNLAKSKKISAALIDRLILNKNRFDSIIQSVETVMKLPDPVGTIDSLTTRPSGIRVGRMRVPIGVVAMIYEARPSVTIDAAVLNIKAGNAVILRGGSEAYYTNVALYGQIRAALAQTGLPPSLVQLVENTERKGVAHLVSMSEYVDLVIPRGGKSLIGAVSRQASVHVLKHLDGNCHVYIDSAADTKMADSISWNAKTRRYGVCNAMESMLVAKDKAAEFLPAQLKRFADHGINLHVCPQTMKYARSLENIVAATEEDWYTEYLGPALSVKIVADIDEAITHINTYGSHHTDAIVTNDHKHAEKFLNQVDSSSVLINASTAFADGYQYGIGAEIGISTDKFHARGPVGLEGLTSQKYIVFGHGETLP